MCKKEQTVIQEAKEFQKDIDQLQEHIFKLDKDWSVLKPVVIMIEEIKLKYLGEYEYSEDY